MPLIVTPRQLNQRAELYQSARHDDRRRNVGLQGARTSRRILRSPDLRRPISQWLEAIAPGPLPSADSLRNIGKWVPSFDLALIDAGERSGRLDACFKLLAVYYRERAQTVRQMFRTPPTRSSSSISPSFSFHSSSLVQKGNLTRFLWDDIGELPRRFMASVSLIIYACQGRHGESWRSVIEQFLARIPVLGTARHDLALARLAMALESLLNAGVPILTAWDWPPPPAVRPRLIAPCKVGKNRWKTARPPPN